MFLLSLFGGLITRTPRFFIRKAPTRWLPRTPFCYDQREGSGEPPNGFADAKRGQCFGQQFVASLTAQCSCQRGHQPPPSLNYHLKKLHFFKFFSNFFWATFLNTTKINIVMIFWKFIYISRNIGKSVETWGSGWGDTYILMGGIFCGGETTPPPKLPQFFSENIFFTWLRTKIIYETTGIFRKIRFSFFSRMTNLAPQDMKFQHSKSMSSVSRWLRTQQKWGDSFYELTGIFRKN